MTRPNCFDAGGVFLLLGLLVGPVSAQASNPPMAQANASPPTHLVYEIFVRSFADGDGDAKGIGDLKGIVNKLDTYLNDGDPKTNDDMEVGILWLMPIFPSPSYHGYDVTDFKDIKERSKNNFPISGLLW